MPDPHIAMQAGKTPEIFEEQVCGNILPVGARRDRNRQQQAETARKRLKGEGKDPQAVLDEQKETGIYNRLEKIGRKRNEVTDNGLKK